MAAASDFEASGAGLSLPRLAIARFTIPFGSPSLSGRSNSTVSTPALVRWAAICAPITPAPRTAARRTSSFSDMSRNSLEILGFAFDPGRREADQLLRGPLPVGDFADTGGALDQPEVGHRIGQGAGQEVQAPVQLLLAEVGHAFGDRPGEVAQHVAVLLGQEAAQAVVLLRIGAGDHADEGHAALAVAGQGQRRLDERGEDGPELARMLPARLLQHGQALPAPVVPAAAGDLVDEAFLAAEAVVDRGG